MNILVIAEHDGQHAKPGTLRAIGFANAVAASVGGVVEVLLLGHGLETPAAELSSYATVITVDAAVLENPVSDRYAWVIEHAAEENAADLLVAASGTFAKDVVSRAAGLLGGSMASDIVGFEREGDELLFRRPMYAGSVIATVRLLGHPRIVTIRGPAFPMAEPKAEPFAVRPTGIDLTDMPGRIEVELQAVRTSKRPDVTDASVVVSGGRAIRSRDDYERLVGALADLFNGATGSSRALVDAGIMPNETQVGQTGKVVAPDLYIALGISGAIQHLAGMKNAKVIAAINNDPDAPIFDIADFGLVADLYEAVPELIEKLDEQTTPS